jgi:hypothetical protein
MISIHGSDYHHLLGYQVKSTLVTLSQQILLKQKTGRMAAHLKSPGAGVDIARTKVGKAG